MDTELGTLVPGLCKALDAGNVGKGVAAVVRRMLQRRRRPGLTGWPASDGG